MTYTVAWRAPDGTTWHSYQGCPAVYDPGTGQWERDKACHEHEHRGPEDGWEPIQKEPLRDPRITRLAELVTAVLDRAPADEDGEIRELLAYVATLPETAQAARHRAVRSARKVAASG